MDTLQPTPEELVDRAVAAFRTLVTSLVVPPTSNYPDDELTIEQAAAALKCSESHVKTLLGMRGGPVEIPYHRRGRRIWIVRKDVDTYKRQTQISAGVMRSPRGRRH